MTDTAAPIDAPLDAPAPTPSRPFTLPLPGLWVFLACLALALLANVGGLRGTGFIGAERDLIRDNDLLNRLPGLQRLWFGGTDPQTYPLPQYAPLAQTTFFIEHALWGNTVWAYRLVSVVLHAGVGLMIWHLLRRLTVPGALACALLFVAHPMTVDSISWVAERRNPLAALLALSSAFLLLRASGVIAPSQSRFKPLPDDPIRLYAIAAILFVLGLFANAAIASLPLVVLLVAWWKRPAAGKVDSKLAGTCVGLVLAGFAMLALTSSIEKARSGAPSPASWNRATTDAGEFAVRTQIAGRAILFYAEKMVLPLPIAPAYGIGAVAIDYPRWQTPRDVEQFRTYTTDAARAATRRPDVAPGDFVAWLFPLAVVGLLVASWMLRDRLGRGQFVCLGAFVLLLAPSLGFIDLGWMRYSFVANRAAYLASIPLLAGLTWGALTLLTRANDQTVTISTAAISVGVFAILSVIVSTRFRNASYFWVQNAGAYPTYRSWWPRYELAASLLGYPDPAALNQAKAAIQDVRNVRPDEPSALVLQGLLKQSEGAELDAVRDFQTSMQTFPNYAPAYFEAAESFRIQADLRPTDPKPRLTALQLYMDAAERDPLDVRSRFQLGRTAFEIARRLRPDDPAIEKYVDQTATAFDEAVQLRPYDVDLLVEISRTLISMGKLSDAGSLLLSARTIEPRRADIYVLIAEAALLARNIDGAESALRTAIEFDPKLVQPYLNLAALRESQERWDEARAFYKQALEQQPDNAEAARRLQAFEARAATQPSARPTTATSRSAG